MKVCKKCGEPKDLLSFTPQRQNSDGRSGTCKTCLAARARELRAANPEAYRVTQAAYQATEKGKATKRRYNSSHSLKIKARNAIRSAIRADMMAPASACECNDCRAPAVELHHESYEPEHWLDVVPLCVSCHKKRHRTPN